MKNLMIVIVFLVVPNLMFAQDVKSRLGESVKASCPYLKHDLSLKDSAEIKFQKSTAKTHSGSGKESKALKK